MVGWRGEGKEEEGREEGGGVRGRGGGEEGGVQTIEKAHTCLSRLALVGAARHPRTLTPGRLCSHGLVPVYRAPKNLTRLKLI